MALEAVFLDVGNTLLTERTSRWEVYAAAARARGVDVSATRMRDLMRAAHEDLPRTLDGAFRYTDPWFGAFIARIFGAGLGLAPEAVEDATEELFARFEDPATFRVHDGLPELLAALRGRDLAVGVVSNWSARLPRLLEALGLLGQFDFVLSSALDGLEKPDPALFERALARAGAAPAAALHAGDHPVLDGAAAELGLHFVLVDHADRHAATPFPRARGLAELSDHVTRLCA